MEINIEETYNEFFKIIDTHFTGERKNRIRSMHESFGERLAIAPASSYAHFHNAFPGGYMEHVIRVVKNSLTVYDMFVELGLKTSTFGPENIVFVALHHDLGKLGYPGEGNETYLPEPEEWWRKNRGRLYVVNEKVPFMTVQDRSLFLLQHFEIEMSIEEYIAIRIHDGLFDEINKPYYITSESAKLKSNLPYIIHTADLIASRFEYERWKSEKPVEPDVKPKKAYTKKPDTTKTMNNLSASSREAFDSIFGKS